ALGELRTREIFLHQKAAADDHLARHHPRETEKCRRIEHELREGEQLFDKAVLREPEARPRGRQAGKFPLDTVAQDGAQSRLLLERRIATFAKQTAIDEGERGPAAEALSLRSARLAFPGFRKIGGWGRIPVIVARSSVAAGRPYGFPAAQPPVRVIRNTGFQAVIVETVIWIGPSFRLFQNCDT